MVNDTESKNKYSHSSCPNAAAYNAVDYGNLGCPNGNSVDRFPSDSGIEAKLRDISETWLPICGARRLRSLRRLIFSHTKRSFWESVINLTTTSTALPQDEYEDPREIKTLKINRVKATPGNLA